MTALLSDNYRRCLRCLRPGSECYCQLVRPYTADTELVVLAHPKEARRRMSTGRIVRSVVDSSHYIIAANPDDSERFQSIVANNQRQNLLIYPAKKSVGFEEEIVRVPQYDGRSVRLIFIEATWHGAKSVYNRSKLLQSMQAVSLNPSFQSRFGIRRQPAEHCLSTVESVVYTLDLLEPRHRQKSENMSVIFDWIVARQLKFEHQNPRHLQRRQKRSRA